MYEKIIKGLKPLSTNVLWQGRRFKTKAYKDYREELGYLLGKEQVRGKNLELTVKFGLPKKSWRTDVSNLIKGLEDAIVDVGIIEDDRYITKLTLEKYPAEDYEIKIKINERAKSVK